MATPDPRTSKPVSAPPAGLPGPAPNYYEYDPPHNVMHISGDLHPSPEFWQSRGDATYLADLRGGAINVVLYPLPGPCQVLKNTDELQAYYRIINRIKLEGVNLVFSGRSFELFSKDFQSPLMSIKPFKPDKFLLDSIESKDRVVYRAKLPLDLKEIETPRQDEPLVIVGTQNGAAVAQ